MSEASRSWAAEQVYQIVCKIDSTELSNEHIQQLPCKVHANSTVLFPCMPARSGCKTIAHTIRCRVIAHQPSKLQERNRRRRPGRAGHTTPVQIAVIEFAVLVLRQGLAAVDHPRPTAQNNIVWHRRIERPCLKTMDHQWHRRIVNKDLRHERGSLGKQAIDLEPLVVEQVTSIFLAPPLQGVARLRPIASDIVQQSCTEITGALAVYRTMK